MRARLVGRYVSDFRLAKRCPSLLIPSTLIKEHEKISRRGSLAELSQKSDHLTTVVRRMVDDVLNHVHEPVFPPLALKILVRKSGQQAVVRKRGDEGLLIAVDLMPP